MILRDDDQLVTDGRLLSLFYYLRKWIFAFLQVDFRRRDKEKPVGLYIRGCIEDKYIQIYRFNKKHKT